MKILETKKRRLEMRYEQVDGYWHIHNRKLASLQADRAKEAGTSVRFQLQEEINREQKQLAGFDNQMVDLETELKRVSYEIEQTANMPEEIASPDDVVATSEINLPELRAKLVRYFSKSELLTISFDLSIDYESELDLSTKQTMVRTLIGYLDRTNQLPKLLSIVRYQRPSVNWS